MPVTPIRLYYVILLFQAGEDDLWYTTVKFTREADDSEEHVTKFDPKSEYATVIINTPDLGAARPDSGDDLEEARDIRLEEWIVFKA